MIKIDVDVAGYGDVHVRLGKIDRLMREKIWEAVEKTVLNAYQRLHENLDGKVLNRKTGELYNSAKYELKRGRWEQWGGVYMDSTNTAKSEALEFGGKGYYPIVATKSEMLVFFWKKRNLWFKGPVVDHPPSEKFAYFEKAIAGMEGELYEFLAAAVGEAVE